MKIGIIGGTFNPVHYGHLRTAEEMREMFAIDKLLFIPAGRPPLKKPRLVDVRHNYEMTKIAVSGNPLFDISDIEIKTRGISYSVETMRKLTDKYRNAEFFFIIGIDAFLSLPKWKEPVNLMELTNLVVISRPGYCFTDLSSSPYFVNAGKKILRRFDKGTRKKIFFNPGAGKKIFLCKVTELDISSSRVRRLIKAGQNIKYLLPESVESYIISHKLYLKNQEQRTRKESIP